MFSENNSVLVLSNFGNDAHQTVYLFPFTYNSVELFLSMCKHPASLLLSYPSSPSLVSGSYVNDLS